jgi:hypothetical protein
MDGHSGKGQRFAGLLLALLMLLAAAPPAAPARATAPDPPALAPADFFGVVGRDPWYEFDPISGQPRREFQETMARNIAATGARWIRIEFHTAYESIGALRAGKLTFAETDLFITEIAPRYGLKVLALINSGIISDQAPDFYRLKDLLDPNPTLRNRYIEGFRDRAREIAARYAGKIGAYEIMNEPNISAELGVTTGFKNQEIPPAVFGELLTQTAVAVRRADPGAPIVVGGLLKGYPLENGNRYTTDYLAALYTAPAVAAHRAAQGRFPFDGVGLHPYPNTALPRSQWLNDTLGLVSQIGNVMEAAGDPGKIWITEIGVKAAPAAQPVAPATDQEAFQATWLRDLYTKLATEAPYRNRVANVFWFKYEDFAPPDQTETWGLVRLEASGTRYDPSGAIRRAKPAFAALHELAFIPASTWLFAEGYTATGFDEFLTIQNPDPTETLVAVTYQPTGAAPVLRSAMAPALSRTTLTVHDLVTGVGRGWPVAARVRATGRVVAERPMYFNYGPGWTGGHVALGAVTPATRWYFAEGYTGAGFDQYLTLQNPSTVNTTVTITYRFADGQGGQQQTLALPAQSRRTVNVHDVVGRGRAVSMIVDSAGGVGIMAERPIYFSYNGHANAFSATGGHVAVGARAPAHTWWFAEGFTGEGFDQYFSILNPNDQPAKVVITYYLPGDRQEQRSLTVEAGRRGTVAVHRNDDPAGLGRGFTNAARLVSDRPVVVERPIYFRYGLRDGRLVDGGHTVVGATTLSTSYGFAEGYTGAGFDMYLTFLNPGDQPNQIQMIFQLDGGATVIRQRTVAPRSRETVAVHDPVAGVGPGQAISTSLVSLDGRPFLSERPMYFNYVPLAGGPGWTGGHVAIGNPG